MKADDTILLGNRHIRVEIDPVTGSILQITNLTSDIRLVTHSVENTPWRIELMGDDGHSFWIDRFEDVRIEVDEPRHEAQLRWTTKSGLVVESTITTPPDADHVAFTITAHGSADLLIDKIEYPILTGIGSLHDQADSLLAHPQGTGFLFRDPLDLFEAGPVHRQGLRYSPYPEGFNGSSMQFMAYFAEDMGGFMMRTPDPRGDMKWLNFYKGEAGALECTFMHQSSDMRPGGDLAVPYPVLIEPLTEGTWYEAADRYKAWALEQPWTAQGPLAARDDRATWLLDEVGLTTFGINAAHDRSKWLDQFHHITGTPVFHVLGVNWPKEPTGYGRGHPGGRDDWFPARFSAENLDTIRDNGDYWAPFEFDLLLDAGKSENDEIIANQLQLPHEKYSFDRYPFRFQCPATGYLPPLHAWRDATLAGEYDADALYYDISANNVLMTCRNPAHGHPVGGGGWMIDAFAEMWEATGKAASAAKGRHVPQGAEMISERFIPSLDYYQARAEASPLSAFEADFFRDWIRDGHAEKIPLFTYVYHEYGPVRMDGWGKLSHEVGELFYWVASRVALWGGLFELNYEFSDLEALEGSDDDLSQHYADIERRAYEVDPAKVDFVREIARARTGFAHPWLVYGTMLRPLDIEVPTTELDYHLYNLGQGLPHYDQKGTMCVDSVVHAAWRAPDGRTAFIFVNLLADKTQGILATIDPSQYGLESLENHTITEITSEGRRAASRIGPGSLEIVLQPRRVTLIEIGHPSA